MASVPRKYLLTRFDGNDEACYMCFVCPDYCTNSTLSPSPQVSAHEYDPEKYQMSPILIVLLCLFAATFLLFSYIVMARRRDSRGRGRQNTNNILRDIENQGSSVNWFGDEERVEEGLPRSMIESMGVVGYRRGEVVRDCCCSICLSEFEEEESLRVLTKCSHAFHVACIDAWLMSHMNCPVCRASVIIDDETNDDISSSAGISDEAALLEVGAGAAAEKMDMRRSLSLDFLHASSIQLVPMKRSSSFTGNTL